MAKYLCGNRKIAQKMGSTVIELNMKLWPFLNRDWCKNNENGPLLFVYNGSNFLEWVIKITVRRTFYARMKKNPLYKIVQWSSIGTSTCFCPCNPICFDVSTFLDPTKVKLRWQRGETENISRRTRNWTHHSNFFYRISLVCKVIRMRRRMNTFFSKKKTW